MEEQTVSNFLIRFWNIFFETPLRFLGLYENSTKRFFGMSGLAAAFLLSYKPESMFYKGMSRPWSAITISGSEEDKISTMVPWWLGSAMWGGMWVLLV